MIKLYSKNNCQGCKLTKRYLQEHNIEYTEINVDEDSEALNYLKMIGISSLPYVEVVETEIIERDRVVKSWSGFQPSKLKELVKDGGYEDE